MGKYENELKQILSEGHWAAVSLDRLDAAIAALEGPTADIASLGGETWSGASADAAREAFAELLKEYRLLRDDLGKIDRIINAANASYNWAANASGNLPTAVVSQDVHMAIDAAKAAGEANVVVGGVAYAVDSAVGALESLFGGNREAKAKATLDELASDLNNLATMFPGDKDYRDPPVPKPKEPEPDPDPNKGTDSGTSVPRVPTYNNNNNNNNNNKNDNTDNTDNTDNENTDNGTNTRTSVDGEGPGYTSNGGYGSGGLGSSGSGGFSGGGTGGALALGAGGAAAAGALRMGTGGGMGGGAGAPAPTGTGGILGGGGGASGTSGGRGGMMGMGGGGGAGGSQKDKRAGTGGHIAPKLEDDDEFIPLSEAAGAGGRRGANSDDATQ